jgi:hypothetical protein
MRNTNLETGLARVTLLLLASIHADLASRRLSTRGFSFTSGHVGSLSLMVGGENVMSGVARRMLFGWTMRDVDVW